MKLNGIIFITIIILILYGKYRCVGDYKDI